MNTELLRALRSTIRADSDPGRQAMFGNLQRQSRAATGALWLYKTLGRSRASTLFVSVYGLKSYLTVAAPSSGQGLLMVSVHANSKKQVHRVAAWFEPGRTHHARIGLRQLLGFQPIRRCLQLLTGWRGVRQHLRLVHAIERRRNFLVSCRVSGLLASYSRAHEILSTGGWSAIVVSSDTNPEEVAFSAAARTLGVPTVFAAHTYPNPFAPPLRFSLSLLEGEAGADARRRQGPIAGEIVLLGLAGESKPLEASRLARPQPAIGVFASKTVDWSRFVTLMNDCRQHFGARQVVIRWHPSMIERPDLAARLEDMAGIVETAPSDAIRNVIDRCDWIVADPNSNVHLDALRLGVPTIAVRMGASQAGRDDIFGFAAAGIFCPPVDSLREVSLPTVIEAFERGWVDRFRRFDAGYLAPSGQLEQRAKDAIERLAKLPRERGASGRAR